MFDRFSFGELRCVSRSLCNEKQSCPLFVQQKSVISLWSATIFERILHRRQHKSQKSAKQQKRTRDGLWPRTFNCVRMPSPLFADATVNGLLHSSSSFPRLNGCSMAFGFSLVYISCCVPLRFCQLAFTFRLSAS